MRSHNTDITSCNPVIIQDQNQYMHVAVYILFARTDSQWRDPVSNVWKCCHKSYISELRQVNSLYDAGQFTELYR